MSVSALIVLSLVASTLSLYRITEVNHSLDSPIKAWRNTFYQWSNLRNSHDPAKTQTLPTYFVVCTRWQTRQPAGRPEGQDHASLREKRLSNLV